MLYMLTCYTIRFSDAIAVTALPSTLLLNTKTHITVPSLPSKEKNRELRENNFMS